MPDFSKKRTLDAFFKPPSKKVRVIEDDEGTIATDDLVS
jgi:hypothetical protein